MGKDRKKAIHIHSSIADRQPTPQSLEVGEIAVNNAANQEFISLKNSSNKVVRFSSDEQMITWGERKEVMPYSGTVDNVHLDTNRSNIEIKLNQVVSKNTAKYNVVNGATDIDGQEVNPSDDGGLTNGAGFAIDMSRYAMIGANPSFSSVTVTHRSNLSGTTNISNGDGGAVLNITTTDVNANDTNWNETITNKTSNITTDVLSGNSLTITENNTKIQSCDSISAKTNAFSVEECAAGNGGATIKETNTTISGTNLTITETNADIESCGRISGKTNAFSIEECAAGGSATIKETTTSISGNTLGINEGTSITMQAPDTNLTGTNLTVRESNTDIQSCTNVAVSTDSFNVKECTNNGGQFNVSATTQNISGGSLSVTETGSTNFNTSGNTCIVSNGNMTVGGNGNTNIGYDCGGNGITDNTNIYASTAVTVNAPDTYINGTLHVENQGLSKTLSWSYGDVRTAVSDSTNFKVDKSFVMPKEIDHLTNYDGTNINLPHPVNVSGTVTATGAIYSSDRNLKENINFVSREDFNKVKNVFTKSFNFKDDETKRKMYGVIAQEVQEAGLDELVHLKDDGNLGVDYTSLLILKIAYLEDFCSMLNGKVVELEEKLNKMGNNG